MQFYIVGIIVFFLGIFTFIYWGSKKQIWFCDEIYTYESSNGFEQPWPAELTDIWQTGKQVESYFAADNDNLSLNDVSVRLYCDHVPLYFWLFRMFSFYFFHGSGSVWIGLSINLIFYLMAIGLIYIVFSKLTGKPLVAGLVSLMTFGTSRLMLEQATTLRMYMMLLVAELLLLAGEYLLMRAVAQKSLPIWEMVLLYGASLFGFLTHYDFWIFYAVTVSLFCSWFLLSGWLHAKKKIFHTREFRLVALSIVNFVLSLGTTIWLFPYCRWNLNRGKGEVALHSVVSFSREKLEHILWGYERFSKVVFGESFPVWIGLPALFGAMALGCVALWKRGERRKLIGFVLTILSTQGYQLLVCFTLPAQEEERYLWGSFSIALFCALYGVVEMARWLLQKKRQYRKAIITVAGIMFLVVIVDNFVAVDAGKGIEYLLCEGKEVSKLEEAKDIPWLVYTPCLSIYSYDDWKIPEKICFLSGEEKEDLQGVMVDIRGEKELILYTNEDIKVDAISFLEQQIGIDYQCEVVTQSTVMMVYKLKANE